MDKRLQETWKFSCGGCFHRLVQEKGDLQTFADTATMPKTAEIPDIPGRVPRNVGNLKLAF